MDIATITVTQVLNFVIPTVLGVVIGWLCKRLQYYKEQMKTIDQIAIMTCRQVIYSDHFDIDEKIDAYILYQLKGGNHRTKNVMSDAVGMDIDEYILNHRAVR